MEKLHYLGLLFLNFAILNILLSFIFFLPSVAGRRLLLSPLLKSRLFFVSLLAPPALSAFTIFTSFLPPLFVKIPGRAMFCLNEPYCYIFSFISQEIPLFDGLLIAAVGLVFMALIYSAAGIVSYIRVTASMDTLHTSFHSLHTAGLENPAYPDRRGFLTPPEKADINESVWEELKKFEVLYKLRVKIIDTPRMISLLWGYLSNTLILSTGVLKTFSIDELRGLLAHELSHHRRRDNILKGILLLCRNSLFIFPHVYYIFRWWREEIEMIGDERAAVITGRPLDVASALIKMMADKGGMGNLDPYAIGFSITRDDHIFTNRVERLVAIHDCKIRPGNERLPIIPSEMGLLISMVSLFPAFFMAIYKFNPLLVHCYLGRLLSVF